jgi:hypothetical protein
VNGFVPFLFVVLLAVQTMLFLRFYRAARIRDPERFEPEFAWAERVEQTPTRLFSEGVKLVQSRLRLLVRSSPYPEVERLRRLTIGAIVLWLGSFVALFFFE